GDPTTFIHIDLGVGASHEPFLASDNPLVSIASRTSSLNPPGYNTVAARLNCPLWRKVEMSLELPYCTATSPDLTG
ncbi:hypothetical protein, partial [Ensifer sp. ENS10]|uniref:hypothetical protein n=1 Tax=Ensifer sp. ENS10 TaxID=2769286 RepID=UPI001AEEB051